MTLALATLGELPETGPAWDAGGLPDVPRRRGDRADPRRAARTCRQFFTQLRPALRAGAAGRRARRDRRLDAHARAARARRPARGGDDRRLAARRLRRAGRFVAAPTLDLTIHIRRPLPPAGMGADDYVLGRFWSRLAVGGVWEEDGELWTPGGELIAQSRQLALARELPRVTARGLPRPGLQRGRPARATCRRRSTRLPAHGVAVLAPRRPTTPSRSARCSTSPSSSTRASASRPTWSPRRCSTRARRSSASSGARPAACATGRGRSTSTCCCWARRRTARSGSRSRTSRSRAGASCSCRCSSSRPTSSCRAAGRAADALEALVRALRAPRRAAAAGGRRRRARIALAA